MPRVINWLALPYLKSRSSISRFWTPNAADMTLLATCHKVGDRDSRIESCSLSDIENPAEC